MAFTLADHMAETLVTVENFLRLDIAHNHSPKNWNAFRLDIIRNGCAGVFEFDPVVRAREFCDDDADYAKFLDGLIHLLRNVALGVQAAADKLEV